MKDLKKERGITLIALIITIIILVILAAVSIRAVTNMKIVDYAVNGAENYAKAGKAENKTLDDTVSFIDESVRKIEEINSGIIEFTIDDRTFKVKGGLTWYDWASDPNNSDDLQIGEYDGINWTLKSLIMYSYENNEDKEIYYTFFVGSSCRSLYLSEGGGWLNCDDIIRAENYEVGAIAY